jgi:YD repeat-containing protein
VKSTEVFRYETVEKLGEITKEEILFAFDKYDEKGNVTERNSSDTDGRDLKNTYKYDKKGNLIERNCYSFNNNWKLINKYNKKGNLIETNYYSSDGRIMAKSTCEYDEKGNLIVENSYNDGKLCWKCINKYDEKGNLIVEETRHSDGKLWFKFTYKYDKQGNWTEKMIEYGEDTGKAGEPDIIKRKIEYYGKKDKLKRMF